MNSMLIDTICTFQYIYLCFVLNEAKVSTYIHIVIYIFEYLDLFVL